MGVQDMQARVAALAKELSQRGLTPVVSMIEAKELVRVSEDLYHKSPQDEALQSLLIGSQILLHSACLNQERPLWLRIAGLGVNELGEPLVQKPASDAVAFLNGLALTNNAIARCVEGEENAHVVATHALEFLRQPGSDADEVAYIENRWTAASLLVLARKFDGTEYTEYAQKYAQTAVNILEKCPAATPTLNEMATILAKPPKVEAQTQEVEEGSRKSRRFRLPKLNVKLPRRFPRFVAYDTFTFNSQ